LCTTTPSIWIEAWVAGTFVEAAKKQVRLVFRQQVLCRE